MHKQPANITVASLADALQTFLTSTRMLFRHQTKESRKLTPIFEGADVISNRGFQCTQFLFSMKSEDEKPSAGYELTDEGFELPEGAPVPRAGEFLQVVKGDGD